MPIHSRRDVGQAFEARGIALYAGFGSSRFASPSALLRLPGDALRTTLRERPPCLTGSSPRVFTVGSLKRDDQPTSRRATDWFDTPRKLKRTGREPKMKVRKPRTDGSRRRAAANLGVRLLSLQEEVQQRIASDLHDSTCQHLIAASLNVMRMRRALNDIGSAERLCDDIDASIDQALREIRAFTYLLHPQNLLADGLKTTIEQFVNGFSARTSLKTSLEIAPEVDKLSYARQRSVLRVIQEALTNVFRHAKATQVKIAMEATNTHFKLRISDNGRGMPIGQARSGPKAISFGVGIPAMRARLQQMGGDSRNPFVINGGMSRYYVVCGNSALPPAQESATARTAS